jgi:hypothetical protein
MRGQDLGRGTMHPSGWNVCGGGSELLQEDTSTKASPYVACYCVPSVQLCEMLTHVAPPSQGMELHGGTN